MTDRAHLIENYRGYCDRSDDLLAMAGSFGISAAQIDHCRDRIAELRSAIDDQERIELLIDLWTRLDAIIAPIAIVVSKQAVN